MVDGKVQMKNQIMKMIKKYEAEYIRIEEELETMEYEPAPSGEMNESLAMMAPLEAEMDTIYYFIRDLELILRT